eukprot:10400517-Ditylum_brightwellii.AAC.1
MHGPDFRYFTEPDESIPVCNAREDVEAVKAVFAARGVAANIHDSHRCMGGFIGGVEEEMEWVKPKIAAWTAGVKVLASFVPRYPQVAYTGLTMSLQAEWQYLQRTVPRVGNHMGALEALLADDFIPALFGGLPPEGIRAVLAHSIKNGGLAISNPVELADENYTTLVA